MMTTFLLAMFGGLGILALILLGLGLWVLSQFDFSH